MMHPSATEGRGNRRAEVWARRRTGGIALVLVGVVAGYALRGCLMTIPTTVPPPEAMHEHTEKAEAQFWTCSMHPQIQQSQAGQCPICGMDLVPVDIGDAQEAGPRVFTTTEEAKALMDIETAPVARKFVTAVVRMVGEGELRRDTACGDHGVGARAAG